MNPDTKPTQLEQFTSILESIPGDTATYTKITRRLEWLKRHADPMYKGPERDGSIDEKVWKYLRNIFRVVSDMSACFEAFERGDDPDIPF